MVQDSLLDELNIVRLVITIFFFQKYGLQLEVSRSLDAALYSLI